MHRYFRTPLVLILVALFATALSTPVSAHGGHGRSATIAQTIGPYTLQIAVIQPATPRSPLVLMFDAHDQPAITAIIVQPGDANQEANRGMAITTHVVPGHPHVYEAEIAFSQAGTWQFDIEVIGSQGRATAMIPVTIDPATPAAATLLLAGSMVAVALVMLVAIGIVAVRGRHRLPLSGSDA